MVNFAHHGSRAARGASLRLRRSRRQSRPVTATLGSAHWDPTGGLRVSVLVRGGRPGPSLIGELRHRNGWALVPFTVRRGSTSEDGTQVEGMVPPETLELLAMGRHDLSLSALVGPGRHLLRVGADPAVSLPGPRNGIQLYVTTRDNISLLRTKASAPAAPAGPPTVGVDPRAVDGELADVLGHLVHQLPGPGALGACDTSYRFPHEHAVRFDALYPGLGVSVLISRVDQGWQVSATGRDGTARRFLRNVLVNRARMVLAEGGERHLVDVVTADGGPQDTGRRIRRVLVGLLDRFRLFLDAGPRPEDHGLVPAQWWDAKPNFGDVLGPLIIEALTGRPAINAGFFPSRDPGLFTVGSIAGHLRREGSRVWGSGLIGELSAGRAAELAARAPRSIHAVRGVRTRRVLQEDLGWQVPEVYGDPALLLPRLYQPRPAPETAGTVVVVPHYAHRRLLPRDLPDGVSVVDVRQGPEVVIDQIVSARACISSSLHGLAVAQAWEIPWTWLRVEDAQLRGDRFKFEDFFSVLDRSTVAELDLALSEVGVHDWATTARSGRVPRATFDAERLIAAFPEV